MDRSLARLPLGIAIALALCLSAPICEGRALAASLSAKDNAKAKQAKQAYKEGQYEEAAKIFSSLSIQYPDKLFFTRNLGACYYYLHRPEPALSNLREYLRRSVDIAQDDRAEVESWIAEMEKLRDQTIAAASAAPAVAGALPAVAVPATTGAPATAVSPVPSQPTALDGNAPAIAAPPALPAATAPVSPTATPVALAAETISPGPASANTGHGLRVAGIACGAVGLVSIGTAVYYYTRATSLSDKVTNSDAPNPADHRDGKNAQTMQWVFYSVGATALATGSVLYYLSWRDSATTATAIAPMVGPGLAGLSVRGAF
jgi:tetratricopeptide (TPR) repeat protein